MYNINIRWVLMVQWCRAERGWCSEVGTQLFTRQLDHNSQPRGLIFICEMEPTYIKGLCGAYEIMKAKEFGRALWLMPVIPLLWEAETVDHLRSGVPDQPGQHDKTPSLLKKEKENTPGWWNNLCKKPPWHNFTYIYNKPTHAPPNLKQKLNEK